MIRKFNVQLKLMGTTTQSIDVNAPIRAVYDQWTQFEEFPVLPTFSGRLTSAGRKNVGKPKLPSKFPKNGLPGKA
jgi:hypothetical protein